MTIDNAKAPRPVVRCGAAVVTVCAPEKLIVVRHGANTWRKLGGTDVDDYFRRRPASDRKLDESAEAANETGPTIDTQHSSGPRHDPAKIRQHDDAGKDRLFEDRQQHDDADLLEVTELVDKRLESLLGVAFVDRVIERLPVGPPDAFALAVGQLGEQVAHAVHGAVLAV